MVQELRDCGSFFHFLYRVIDCYFHVPLSIDANMLGKPISISEAAKIVKFRLK